MKENSIFRNTTTDIIESSSTSEDEELFGDCAKGNAELLKKTLSGNLNRLNKRRNTNFGESLLHIACKQGRIEIVKVLLEKGADLECASFGGFKPLHMSVLGPHAEITQILLSSGAVVDSLDDKKYTPLHLACKVGNFAATRILIDNGASLLVRTNENETPLLLACKHGRKELVEFFFNSEGETASVDNCGNNCLQKACEGGDVATVSFLINHGFDAKFKNLEKQTSLHIVGQRGHHRLVQILINARSDLNCKDIQSNTPLHLACQWGHTRTAQELLLKGAEVDACDFLDSTPLHYACQLARLDIIDVLVNRNCDIQRQNKYGESPLHVACHWGQTDVVETLLYLGSDIHLVTREGDTALHIAAFQGHVDIVKCLLDRGAYANVSNKMGELPGSTFISKLDSTAQNLICGALAVANDKVADIIQFQAAARRPQKPSTPVEVEMEFLREKVKDLQAQLANVTENLLLYQPEVEPVNIERNNAKPKKLTPMKIALQVPVTPDKSLMDASKLMVQEEMIASLSCHSEIEDVEGEMPCSISQIFGNASQISPKHSPRGQILEDDVEGKSKRKSIASIDKKKNAFFESLELQLKNQMLERTTLEETTVSQSKPKFVHLPAGIGHIHKQSSSGVCNVM